MAQGTALVGDRIGCVTAVTGGSLGTVPGTGGIAIREILGERMAQGTALVGHGIGCTTAVTGGSLGAVFGAGGVIVGSIIPISMSQSGVCNRPGHRITALAADRRFGAVLGTGFIVVIDEFSQFVTADSVHRQRSSKFSIVLIKRQQLIHPDLVSTGNIDPADKGQQRGTFGNIRGQIRVAGPSLIPFVPIDTAPPQVIAQTGGDHGRVCNIGHSLRNHRHKLHSRDTGTMAVDRITHFLAAELLRNDLHIQKHTVIAQTADGADAFVIAVSCGIHLISNVAVTAAGAGVGGIAAFGAGRFGLQGGIAMTQGTALIGHGIGKTTAVTGGRLGAVLDTGSITVGNVLG